VQLECLTEEAKPAVFSPDLLRTDRSPRKTSFARDSLPLSFNLLGLFISRTSSQDLYKKLLWGTGLGEISSVYFEYL